MPDLGSTNNLPESLFRDDFPTCDSTDGVCMLSLQPGPVFDNGNNPLGPLKMPKRINYADAVWRERTMRDKQHIPAGYTYFGQLIGHDLGKSTNLSHVPYSRKVGMPPKPATDHWYRGRYNLIENPLTLETLYGAGPMLLPHLFDQKTFLFRTEEGLIISKKLSDTDPSIRAIYDSRNRDTTILHRLTTIIMKFHNKVALEFWPKLNTRAYVDPKKKRETYAVARNHVLSVWHDLIRADFLSQFVLKDIMEMKLNPPTEANTLDETTVQHGLFRAFHALPRKEYRFTKQKSRTLKSFLLDKLENDEKDVSQWELDWDMFFDENAEGTKTGICASFSPSLANNGELILRADLSTVDTTGPLRFGNKVVQRILRLLPVSYQDQLDPAALAKSFTSRYASEMKWKLSAEEVRSGPIFLVLMIEAQLYGDNGKFGPLGSLMLRRVIEQAISKTEFLNDQTPEPIRSKPSSMLELIRTV